MKVSLKVLKCVKTTSHQHTTSRGIKVSVELYKMLERVVVKLEAVEEV